MSRLNMSRSGQAFVLATWINLLRSYLNITNNQMSRWIMSYEKLLTLFSLQKMLLWGWCKSRNTNINLTKVLRTHILNTSTISTDSTVSTFIMTCSEDHDEQTSYHKLVPLSLADLIAGAMHLSASEPFILCIRISQKYPMVDHVIFKCS